MKTLFLIPARGGSKGFPRKNVAGLAGIPLVGWAARLACRAAQVHPGSRVVCSTDDAAIAEAARIWGADVPFVRPAELATDDARSLDVVVHTLNQLADDFEAVVLLQPTSPLTELEDVLGALQSFVETRRPVVGVTQAGHPLEWCCRVGHDDHIQSVAPDTMAHRRQLGEPLYCPNGAIYVASVAQVRAGGFWGPETRALIMGADRSVDVDAPSDLAIAEALLAARPLPVVEIAGRSLAPGHPCFVIAEAGVNHNGSLEMALQLVDVAANAGADAVKFQSFKAEKGVSPTAPKAAYQEVNTGSGESQLDMVRRLQLSASQHREIQARCREKGILFLSSPFDKESVDLLIGMKVPALKIASGEITNHGLLSYAAKQGVPLILSSGMSSMVEVNAALDVIRRSGSNSVVLLHCVSNYPAAAADCNLAAMDSMRKAFCLPIGWSDHTLGIHISLAAAARGAVVIEKHFTLDRNLPGPDHVASLEPDELRALVESIKAIELSIGTGTKVPCISEHNTAAIARKSIFAARAMCVGHEIVEKDLVMLRPGTGVPASRIDEVIGRLVSRSIQAGQALSEDDLL